MKLCVSSRPWNAFEDTFGRDLTSKLYVHELTENDITLYVSDRLQTHPRWGGLCIEAPDTSRLVEDVTARAVDVFLWVFLVTELLRNGLTEYDILSDLKQRLESFPIDLEGVFKHILETVEPFHHSKMAATLRVALTADRPLNILLHSFLEQEFEDVDYALHLPLERPPEERLLKMCESTA